MNIIEKNELIAKWLGWDNEYSPDSYFPPINVKTKLNIISDILDVDELKFDSDNNWQMICLEHIMLDEGLDSLSKVYLFLEGIHSKVIQKEINIKTNTNVIDAIISYINY